MLASPIESPVRITQFFGERPEFYKKLGQKGHTGIDMTGPKKGVSVPVYAPFEGTITFAGKFGGYGNCVRVLAAPDSTGRRREATLAHLASIAVTKGQYVFQLDSVGMMGNTGISSSLHLHVALRYLDAKGKVIDAGNGFDGFVPLGPGSSPLAYMFFWKRSGPDMVTIVNSN